MAPTVLVLCSVLSVQTGQAIGKHLDYPLIGILFALASGASMAAYLLLSRRAGAVTTNAAPLALAVAWSALLTLPFGITDSGTALLSPRVLVIGVVVAVLSAAVQYSLNSLRYEGCRHERSECCRPLSPPARASPAWSC